MRFSFILSGRGGRIRTGDILLPKDAKTPLDKGDDAILAYCVPLKCPIFGFITDRKSDIMPQIVSSRPSKNDKDKEKRRWESS